MESTGTRCHWLVMSLVQLLSFRMIEIRKQSPFYNSNARADFTKKTILSQFCLNRKCQSKFYVIEITSGDSDNRPYAYDVISVRRSRLEVKRRLFIGQSMCVVIVSSSFDLKDCGWMTSKVYSTPSRSLLVLSEIEPWFGFFLSSSNMVDEDF